MQILRLLDLSIIYWLKDKFNTDGWDETKITILDGYPEDRRALVDPANYTDATLQKKLPVVAVEIVSSDKTGLELGSRAVNGTYRVAMDVFASTDGQRDDIAYFCEKYTNGYNIPIKDYNTGFPPGVTNQTTVGAVFVTASRLLNTSDKASSDIASRHSMRIIITCEGIEDYS